MAMEVQRPELKYYMEKRLLVKMNGNRRVVGVLRGYDDFMNLVLDETFDATKDPADQSLPLGTVVCAASD